MKRGNGLMRQVGCRWLMALPAIVLGGILAASMVIDGKTDTWPGLLACFVWAVIFGGDAVRLGNGHYTRY